LGTALHRRRHVACQPRRLRKAYGHSRPDPVAGARPAWGTAFVRLAGPGAESHRRAPAAAARFTSTGCAFPPRMSQPLYRPIFDASALACPACWRRARVVRCRVAPARRYGTRATAPTLADTGQRCARHRSKSVRKPWFGA